MTTLMLDYFFLKSEGDASTATCLAAYVPQMQYGFAKVYEGKSAYVGMWRFSSLFLPYTSGRPA